MSVYLHKNSPFWQFDFQCRGRRFCGSFDGQEGRPELRRERSKKEAERAEAVLRAASTDEKRERQRLTLHQAAAHFWTMEAQHFRAADSFWGYISNLERIIGKTKFVDEIDDEVVAKFVAVRRSEKARRKLTTVANKTVNNDIDALVGIFKSVKKIARMPAEMPEWSRHRLATTERIRALSADEDAALFAAIDELRPDFRDIWEFKLLCGKRLSEVMFMEKAKIDRRARTARVIQKGGKEVVIALTATMIEIVERNWMNHPTLLWTYVCKKNWSGKGASGQMLHHRAGQRYPFTIDGWREQWKAILVHAKIEDFRVHDFRHTTATRVLAATNNLKLVQETLDHRDIRSSARYAHTFTEQRRAALEAAEKLRGIPEKSRKDGTSGGNS